jgi:hypothetical protein
VRPESLIIDVYHRVVSLVLGKHLKSLLWAANVSQEFVVGIVRSARNKLCEIDGLGVCAWICSLIERLEDSIAPHRLKI